MNENFDNILPIKGHLLPFDPNEKVFYFEDEDEVRELFSFNDSIKMLTSISGINEDLLGENTEEFND